MRRLLGTLPALVLAPLLLAGCGEDEAPTASDPASEAPTSSPTASDLPTTVPPGDEPTKSPPLTPGGVPFELVEIVSATAGGGQEQTGAVPITSTADAQAYAAAFSPELAADVEQALAAHPARSGQTLYAAVVGLGCDVPPGVDVSAAGDGYEITGLKVADPIPECFAPVTSVAIVAIGG